jgi:hypothetical protein
MAPASEEAGPERRIRRMRSGGQVLFAAKKTATVQYG